MNVAVLTLCRDRLSYSQHCFAALHANAGMTFDHHVLDQGSTDGTPEWLKAEFAAGRIHKLTLATGNMGISRGMNTLLDGLEREYDVVVKFDNDCELVQPHTLYDVAYLAAVGSALLSPRIQGLINPPAATGTFSILGETILDILQIGGIFLAAPAAVYERFRYDDGAPTWGTDDITICRWHRLHGGRCGYVNRLTANHYETTVGQQQRFPDYWQRKLVELAA